MAHKASLTSCRGPRCLYALQWLAHPGLVSEWNTGNEPRCTKEPKFVWFPGPKCPAQDMSPQGSSKKDSFRICKRRSDWYSCSPQCDTASGIQTCLFKFSSSLNHDHGSKAQKKRENRLISRLTIVSSCRSNAVTIRISFRHRRSCLACL